MTPTEQEIEFFKEAQRIQEEWEPKCGDWYVSAVSGVYGIGWNEIPRLSIKEERVEPANEGEVIWLPRQGQLRAMLEQRGYTVCLTGPYMLPKNYQVILAREDDETEVEYGPTPSIALGRALIEVMQDE